MSYPDADFPGQAPTPLPVTINNWPDNSKTGKVRKTTVKTYIMDPTGVNGVKVQQICDYEPTRLRLVLQVYDGPIALTTDPPTASPDISSATQAPQGRLIDVSAAVEHPLFGPDAFWINSLTTFPARVTVTKEYE